ncbi:YCF48-related protein [Pirellulaceae bacterium]|nr:YCF48-related protein [Pirellulaceae bacterium]
MMLSIDFGMADRFGGAVVLIICQLMIGAVLLSNAQAQVDSPAALVFKELKSGSTASFRGLCVVDERTIWASGSQGTVIHSQDAGATWQKSSIKEAGEIEFRDIQAFDDKRAVVLGAGSPAQIYSTQDGGRTWELKYENRDPGVFFDAFSFFNDDHGIAFSDPLKGKIFLIETRDGGKSWEVLPAGSLPVARKKEAGFAASGTCLITYGPAGIVIGLGGAPQAGESIYSRVLLSSDRGQNWKSVDTTLGRSESAGIFSLVHFGSGSMVAVGGDYLQPTATKDCVSISHDNGISWHAPRTKAVRGFRSCIAAGKLRAPAAIRKLSGSQDASGAVVLVTTGTNGTDFSVDRGETWWAGGDQGYHALMFVPGKPFGFASGGNGKMARFDVSWKK